MNRPLGTLLHILHYVSAALEPARLTVSIISSCSEHADQLFSQRIMGAAN